MNWSDIKMKGIARVDRLAAVFDIWSDGVLPFAKFKVKVIERRGDDFLGVPNVAIRNPQTGEPDYTSGMGKTIEDALAETLSYFMREVERCAAQRELMEGDFVWSSFEDF